MIQVGDRIRIVKSWHHDVVPGTEGVVVAQVFDGYGVEIRAAFTRASGDKVIETRCIYFEALECEPAKLPLSMESGDSFTGA